MKIDKELIENISKNARLKLSDKEAEKFSNELKDVLEAFSKLKEVNTDKVEPAFHPIKIVNVVREDNVSMINPIGVGILENIGLNPFMKNIAKFLLDEELILPQIATWWCGQKKELDFVIKNIKTTHGNKVGHLPLCQTIDQVAEHTGKIHA